MEEFHRRTPAIQFDALCGGDHCYLEKECSICLTEIEPDEELNHITCGHVFHKTCLKWLMRWNISCPRCRSRFVPQDVEDIDEVLDVLCNAS
ncbi:putative E3 ubiquitin-protein ligase XERICO [Camellia lanceoleosa]|uniref:E3 ubiquitin-protein ligase XERICO n=1 Tax=Camellia lanceoleosa TaxID=1840588 RepID=A0ACC0H183_9ERIC|nr:putative E3 ubiquitin-protein ligase XERICO [Camellia lanceoleosa]